MANLTAEDPDQLKCFRFAFTPSSSLVCEFPITICNDFASVGGDVGVLCAPPPSITNGTNPPAPIIYSSNAQTCTVDCGDFTSETYTVVSGTFVALTQGDADFQARFFACQLAAMLCDGPLPPTFTNAKQTCVATCTNGATVSYSTPAGLFTALSQAEADSNAFLFACEIAALLCDDLPPTGTLPGGGAPRPPVAPLYASAAATCVTTCPNGSQYAFTVGAGAFTAESRDAANAMASSYACRQAQLRRVCLSDLPSSLCVDEFESEFVDSTGLAQPVSYAVTSGSLPPGMTLDQSGFFSGTPTIAGAYGFVITATGSDGQSTSRAYSVSVAGIDQVVLADAELNETYLEVLTQTGMTGAVTWAITDGFLPAGLALDADGTIEGTPTESGDFPVEISITNGADTCHRAYVLTVEASTIQAYWRLEGPTAANHDEITGDLLTYNNFGAILTSPPAVVGNGLDIGGAAFCTFQQQGSTLAYTAPTGFSVAMWIRWSSAATGNEGFTYQWDNIGLPGFLSWIVGTGEYHFANLGVDTTGNTALLAADVFHFVVFTYDPADNNLRASFDGGAFVILGNPGVVTPVADATAYLLCGNEAVLYDEVQLYSFPLRPVDVAYLFNGGAGRVYPPVFPP